MALLRAESEDQHLNASVYVGHDSSSLSDVCVTCVCHSCVSLMCVSLICVSLVCATRVCRTLMCVAHSCVSHTHVCASITLIRIRGDVCVLGGG